MNWSKYEIAKSIKKSSVPTDNSKIDAKFSVRLELDKDGKIKFVEDINGNYLYSTATNKGILK